jgi:hypothetical protein
MFTLLDAAVAVAVAVEPCTVTFPPNATALVVQVVGTVVLNGSVNVGLAPVKI